MMKKMAALAMALVMMAALGAQAAESEAGKYILEGPITQMLDDGQGFLMEDTQFGIVQVHVAEDTQVRVDGDELELGLYVQVEYSGAMTFSLPGQVTAISVTGFMMEGTVVSIEREGKAIMVSSAGFGEVLVNLPEGSKDVPAPGSFVRVYFNGVMAASSPGQISAWHVDSFARFEGQVTEVSEAGILLTAEDGRQMVAKLGEGTLYADEVKEGDEAEVLYNGILTRSLPPQGNAIYLRVLAGD